MKEKIKLGLLLGAAIGIFGCNDHHDNNNDNDLTDSANSMYNRGQDNMNGQNTQPSITTPMDTSRDRINNDTDITLPSK